MPYLLTSGYLCGISMLYVSLLMCIHRLIANQSFKCEELGKLDDPRQALAGTVAVDYLIDCHYEPNVNKLFLVTGTNRCYYFAHHYSYKRN